MRNSLQNCKSINLYIIIKVRSTEDKRIRYVSKYRADKREEMMTGLYRIANVRQGDKPKTGGVKKEE